MRTAGTPTCPRPESGTRYGFRATGRWAPAEGSVAQRVEAAARPLRGDRRRGRLGRGLLRLPVATSPTSPRPPTARRSCPARWWTSPWFDWGNDRPPDMPMHESFIYELHVKGFTARHPDVDPAHPGHLRRARAPRGRSPTCSAWGSRRSSCSPCTPSCTTSTSSSRASATTGATTASASSPRTPATPRAGDRGRGVQARWCAAARGRHRGDPRRRLQPHRRGQPPGADAVHARASTTASTTASRTTPATTGTTPAPATRWTCADPTRCSWSWTACATGSTEMHVDGFRFDLASALARGLHEVDRLGPFFDLIQQDPVVSRHQADRRAVGHR